MQKSRYVELFDDHSSDMDVTLRRQVVGLRWDYARRQAMTLRIVPCSFPVPARIRSARAVVSKLLKRALEADGENACGIILSGRRRWRSRSSCPRTRA